jgi:sugar lactone lactonase YvrE
LFVTSASVGLSEAELREEPLAGSLFSVELEDAEGVPGNYFGL